MKNTTTRLLLGTLLLLGISAQGFAQGETRTTVDFTNPDKFTDFKDSIHGTASGQKQYIARIREFVEGNASKLLPAGQKLAITFTDIDLAGAFSAGPPQTHDRRKVEDYYAIPRMKFTYRITDAAGGVVKEGSEDISEGAYTRAPVDAADTMLVYDLALLRKWMEWNLK